MNILKNKIISFGIIAVLIGAGIFFYSQNQDKVIEKKVDNSAKVQEILKEARKYFEEATPETYNIRKADSLYHEVYQLDPNNQEALFQLVRAHYIQAEFHDALAYADIYKKKFPNDGRIYYVTGLTNAYAGNLDASIKEFEKFIASNDVDQAGYLDIAWVYFQKGDFEKAEKYLEEGIVKYGDNPWLNTSLGMVKFNLGKDKKEVLALLEKAQKQLADQEGMERAWKINYSSNNPKDYKNDIQRFRDIVNLNIKIVNGKNTVEDVAKITEGLHIEALSPRGLKGGYAVSACCDSKWKKDCDGPKNSCGLYYKGKYDCSGRCKLNSHIKADYYGKPSNEYCKTQYFEYGTYIAETESECDNVKRNNEWSNLSSNTNKCIKIKGGEGKKAVRDYELDFRIKKIKPAKLKLTKYLFGNIKNPIYYNEDLDINKGAIKKDSITKSKDQRLRIKTSQEKCTVEPITINVCGCYGEIESGAKICPKDNEGFSSSSPIEWRKVLSCTSARKCEYVGGGNPNGCTGVLPADTQVCPDDMESVNVNTAFLEVNSCTNTRKCEYTRNTCVPSTWSWKDNKKPVDVCDTDYAYKISDCGTVNAQQGTKNCGSTPLTSTVSWSTDKVHWSEDFDKLIILKSKNSPIYTMIEPGPGSCSTMRNSNKRLSFENKLSDTLKPVSRGHQEVNNIPLKIIDSTMSHINEMNYITKLTPKSDDKTGIVYYQDIKFNYCKSIFSGWVSDNQKQIRFKIVDIEEREI